MWESGVVIVIVATTEEQLSSICGELVDRGAGEVRFLAPGGRRRLVLASIDDEALAWRVAADLRAGGRIAVARPDGGGRLEAWVRHTAPVTFGERLTVCFAWSEHDRSELPHLIELGPGGFGNGEHPATRLLIEQLLQRIEGGERVLDLGCGSGVLGLCALELGARDVVATDLKTEAVEATMRNACLNGMDGWMQAAVVSPDELDGTFDVIVANVGRDAVVGLAGELVRLVGPGGWLGVSGISAAQCSQVAEFLRPLEEIDRQTSGEWSALILRKPDHPSPNG